MKTATCQILMAILLLHTTQLYGQSALPKIPPAGYNLTKYESQIHLREAVERSRMAVIKGKEGQHGAQQTNIDYALSHAKSAQLQIKHPDLENGINDLAEASARRKVGQQMQATQLTERAFKSLSKLDTEVNRGIK